MTMYEAFMKSPEFKKDRQVDNWIRENLNQANDFIYSKSLKNPNERGMGTTAVGVIVAHIGTFIFNVGDSRIYGYVEKRVISDIVHDDTLSLKEKTETLIARANQSGGYDNCTVILMENSGE